VTLFTDTTVSTLEHEIKIVVSLVTSETKNNRKMIDNLEMVVFNNELESSSQLRQAEIQGNTDVNTINNYNSQVIELVSVIRSQLEILNKEQSVVEKLMVEFCDSVGYCLVRFKKIGKMIDDIVAEKFKKASEILEEEFSKKVEKVGSINDTILDKYKNASTSIQSEISSIKAICSSSIAKLDEKLKSLSAEFTEFKASFKTEQRSLKDSISNIISALNQYQ